MSGVPIHFADGGAGEVLVLLHAFPLDGRMWAAQASELRTRVRVIVPDLRGFGRSALVASASSMEQMADDVASMLDRLGVARATLVGLSMGGYVALAFARRHRDRMARIGLCDTRAGADSEETRQAREDNIALVETAGTGALVERMLSKLLSAGAHEEQKQFVRMVGGSQTPAGVQGALAAMRDRFDSRPLLSTLDLPAAVIVGEHDAIAPPGEAESMAREMPQAVLHVLPHAGHLANLEAPADFTDAVAALVERPA